MRDVWKQLIITVVGYLICQLVSYHTNIPGLKESIELQYETNVVIPTVNSLSASLYYADFKPYPWYAPPLAIDLDSVKSKVHIIYKFLPPKKIYQEAFAETYEIAIKSNMVRLTICKIVYYIAIFIIILWLYFEVCNLLGRLCSTTKQK